MSTKRLTFLLDRDDLACVEAMAADALSGTVVAFDADLHAYLLDRGMKHITPWDFLGPQDRRELARFEGQLWDFWDQHAHAFYNGVDCLAMVRYRHMRWVTRLAWVAFVVGRALDRLGCDEVYTFQPDTGHGLDQPPENKKMPLLYAVVRGMAQQAGCVVRLIGEADYTHGPVFEDRVADVKQPDLPPVDPQSAFGDGSYILFVGNGGELVRQLPVIHTLTKQGGFKAIQLYKTADPKTLERLAVEGHAVWHESQVVDTALMDKDDSWMPQAREGFDRACQTAGPGLRGVFDNPYLHSHFDFIFGPYLVKMAGHVRAWQGFLGRWRPQVLVGNYATPILDVAGSMGIPGLVLPHGLLVQADGALYRGLPDTAIIGAVNDEHQDHLVEAGIGLDRIRVTGDPGEDLVNTLPQTPAIHLDPDQRFEHRRKVLLLTSHSTAPATLGRLPEVNWKQATRCMEELADLSARQPQWDMVLKPHPRYDYGETFYDRINRRLPLDRRIVVVDTPLDELVAGVDVVVVANAMTSGMIEASVGNIPVYLLDGALGWCNLGDWGLDRWPRVGTVGELEQELETIFRDTGAYHRRLEQSQEACRRYLGGGGSVVRCVEVVKQLVSGCAL